MGTLATVVIHEDPRYDRSKLVSPPDRPGEVKVGLHLNVLALGDPRPGVQVEGVSTAAGALLTEVRVSVIAWSP